jgi:hypothetical protein
MTAKELAQQLNGLPYPFRAPADLVAKAKAEGLVILYGASDDLMKLVGAFNDEVDCYNGGTGEVDAKGVLPSFEDLEGEDKATFRKYFQREARASSIRALWSAEPGYLWTYLTDIPYEPFELLADGRPLCRGIVFAVSDLGPKPPEL